MTPESNLLDPALDPVPARNTSPPLPAMKLSLFHSFVFLPAWFRSVEPEAPPLDSDSESEPGTVASVWTDTHRVRFPLYVNDVSQPRSRGQRGDHPW